MRHEEQHAAWIVLSYWKSRFVHADFLYFWNEYTQLWERCTALLQHHIVRFDWPREIRELISFFDLNSLTRTIISLVNCLPNDAGFFARRRPIDVIPIKGGLALELRGGIVRKRRLEDFATKEFKLGDSRIVAEVMQEAAGPLYDYVHRLCGYWITGCREPIVFGTNYIELLNLIRDLTTSVVVTGDPFTNNRLCRNVVRKFATHRLVILRANILKDHIIEEILSDKVVIHKKEAKNIAKVVFISRALRVVARNRDNYGKVAFVPLIPQVENGEDILPAKLMSFAQRDFLAWCVEGARAYFQRGLTDADVFMEPPPITRVKYKALMEDWIKERVVRCETFTTTKTLLDDFNCYAMNRGAVRPYPLSAFVKIVTPFLGRPERGYYKAVLRE